MIATMLYAEVYAICLIVVGLILFWAVRLGDDSLTSIWFRFMLIVFAVNFAVNLLFTLVNGGVLPQPENHVISLITKTLYHLSLAAGVAAWGGYAMAEQGRSLFGSARARRKYLLLFAFPFLNVLQNLFTGTMFTVDGGVYSRHGMFHVQMAYLLAVSGLFSVVLIKNLVREMDPARIHQLQLVCSFPLCLAAAWALSLVGESVPVICVCVMLELLCLYVGLFTQQISMDKLTQVNNRQNLIKFIDYKIRSTPRELYLLILDLDEFKQINDTFGHLEGDRALICFSQALKDACSTYRYRPYIARYGGDEFMIVTEAQERAEMDALMASIEAGIEEQNAKSGKPYRLKASMGLAKYREGMNHSTFISAADQELYRIKEERKAGKKRG